jgi:hypothetical protein
MISPDIGVRLSSYYLIFDIFLAGQMLLVNEKLIRRLTLAFLFSAIAIYKVSTYAFLGTYIYHFVF